MGYFFLKHIIWDIRKHNLNKLVYVESYKHIRVVKYINLKPTHLIAGSLLTPDQPTQIVGLVVL